MNKMVFVKVFAVAICVLFMGTSLVPIIESTSFQQSPSNGGSLMNEKDGRGRPDGLAPKTIRHQKESQKYAPLTDREYFYAWNAYDPSGGTPEGPITFDAPGDITSLAPSIFPNFCAGGDIDGFSGNWYGCDYGGGLYLIDPDTGMQTYIAPTIGVNAMTYDGSEDTWYVSSSNNLYIMDVTNGQTTLIGPHNINNIVIGLACDIYGNMYAYDVLWTGDSTLYSLNKTTGACIAIGSMGYGFIYAQGCDYDDWGGMISVAGYFNDGSPSALLTCDSDTGEATIVGNFEGGMEVDGVVAPTVSPPPHDIAVRRITTPSSGNATIITPEVKIVNSGVFDEYNVSINLRIGKEQRNGTVEDFEVTNGSYIHAPKLPQPDAWQWGAPTSGPGAAHNGNNVWATNLAGPYPPSMWCYLLTPPVIVPSNAVFHFWHWYYFENNYDGGNVKISNDSGITWTLINPVGGYPGSMPYNPNMTGQPAYNGQSGGWKQANFDLSDFVGQSVQIMFETASDTSVQYAGWYIDDVGFTTINWINEYNQTVTIPMMTPSQQMNVTFPAWTPVDLGSIENMNINYKAQATNLHDDNIPSNDYKEKEFTLYFGYFHDVAVAEIVSPQSGLAQTQTPMVVIENHGQNDENVNVTMNIGKALYTTLLEEDFAGGVPPTGWGTTHPSNWMSSSTSYAGGTAPEAQFSWTPSSIGEHLLYTGAINTTGYTALLLKFKEYVNDYNGDYSLKIVTSTDGTNWTDAYVRTGGPYGPTTTEVVLTVGNGVGNATFYIAWDMSGNSFNINYWYIDDIWMGCVDMIQEYNETTTAGITTGGTVNVSLPAWTPADINLATTIDYLINASVSMNASDGHPADNHLSKLITLSYEHDVGVIEITQPDNPTHPGTYPVEGIIQNLGVTYSEADIPVNAKITNDTGVVFYNETVIVAGPLAPGATATVIFPDLTIPSEPGAEGDYKLTMKTILVGDDHPGNDKKILTWIIWTPDTTPPTTTAELSGTMGWNDWYISNVQVTLTATDGKWPSGVNHTYYNIDGGPWAEYTTPIIVDTDGYHIICYYSDDHAGNIEIEHCDAFKIDMTVPIWTNYTLIPQNVLKTKWLLNATVSDATSGLNYVEFYVDDALIGTVEAPGPYKFLFEGKPANNSQALAYDLAGNSALSPIAQYVELSYQCHPIVQFIQQIWKSR